MASVITLMAVASALVLVIVLFPTLMVLEISLGLDSREHLHQSNCTITACQLVPTSEFVTREILTLTLIWNDQLYNGSVQRMIPINQMCPPSGTLQSCYFDDTDISSSLSLRPISPFNWSFIIGLILATGLNSLVLVIVAIYIYRARQRLGYETV